MVEMFEEISNTFSISRLSPAREMAIFQTSIVKPATTIASHEVYERFPVLNFSCPTNFIPVVLTLDYTADNCDLDLGPSFRFPCPGTTTSSCIRNDMEQVREQGERRGAGLWCVGISCVTFEFTQRTSHCSRPPPNQFVRSCYSEIPIDPPDFLPADYTLYSTNLDYICFDRSKPLSVLGELIQYPGSGTLTDAFASHKFDHALKLPVGKYAATYPGPLSTLIPLCVFNFNFYIHTSTD